MIEQPNGLWMGFPMFYTNTFDKYHPLFDFKLPHRKSGGGGDHINLIIYFQISGISEYIYWILVLK